MRKFLETIFGNHFTPFYYTLFSLYNILIYNNIERKNKDSKHAFFAMVSKVSKNIRSLKGVYRGSEGAAPKSYPSGIVLKRYRAAPYSIFCSQRLQLRTALKLRREEENRKTILKSAIYKNNRNSGAVSNLCQKTYI